MGVDVWVGMGVMVGVAVGVGVSICVTVGVLVRVMVGVGEAGAVQPARKNASAMSTSLWDI